MIRHDSPKYGLESISKPFLRLLFFTARYSTVRDALTIEIRNITNREQSVSEIGNDQPNHINQSADNSNGSNLQVENGT